MAENAPPPPPFVLKRKVRTPDNFIVYYNARFDGGVTELANAQYSPESDIEKILESLDRKVQDEWVIQSYEDAKEENGKAAKERQDNAERF